MRAVNCVALLLAGSQAEDHFFATDAMTAIQRLRAALPYDAAACTSATAPDARVACAERAFLDRAAGWLDWHAAFRSAPCARFCDTCKKTSFAYQGHRRFRKGYGNHVFASLRALVVAIQQNKSAVLGLDDKTRELNTPHLRYDDASVWTLDALRRKYVLCRCAPASVRGSRPHQALAHLPGLGFDERLPLAASDPTKGAGLVDVLGWAATGLSSTRVGGDATTCGRRVGHSALRPAFDELVGAPNAFGLLFYAFFRPAAPIRAYVAKALERSAFDVAVHVRISARENKTLPLQRRGRRRRRTPQRRLQETEFVAIEAQPWFDALGRAQLPRLLLAAGRVLRDAPRLGVFSDRPHISRALAARLPGAVALDSETDARAFGDGVAALTAEERDGRAMLRSADWGASPRWAALADLYLLSAAGTVACAGPYAPSTFCELAAALSAVRVGLKSPRTRTGALWRSGRNASQFPALVWCPAVAREDSDDVSRRRRRRWAAAPRCCETTLLG